MNANDIQSQLILNQITVTQAMLLTKLHCTKILSEESIRWIDYEIKGYDNGMQLPDYRLLDCDLCIEVYNGLGNKSIQRLDTSNISAYLKEGGYESSSPDIMHIMQGLEYLEEISMKETGNLKLYLNDGLKNMILQWYDFPAYVRFGRIYQESNIAYVKELLTKVKSHLMDVLQKVSTMESSNLLNEETNQPVSNKIGFVSPVRRYEALDRCTAAANVI